MKTIAKILLISIIFFLNFTSIGQIKLSSPQERSVYQRNGGGASTVIVAGYYQQQIDRIEYRLMSASPDQNYGVDWTLLKTLPLNGNFSVPISVRQGWYTLEVRGILNGQVFGDVARVNRMGVGEVFIIAGQSNAQGVNGIQGIGATDDRVNSFGANNDDVFGGNTYINLSNFSKLDANNLIAPRGPNAWCWGKLGDLLVQRFKVPVIFYNAAAEGTSSDAWAVSARGLTARNPYTGGIYNNNAPYRNLSDVLRAYVAQFGVRAVLWCQGEADNNLFNSNPSYSSSTYEANLQTVINRSRDETGKNISWVVAQTSATTICPFCVSSPFAPSSDKVLEGQRATTRETSNVFQGPSTDPIQNPGRRDGVHFSGNGLSQLAEAWNGSLNDNFFNNSTPQSPTSISDIAYNCGDNQVEVTLPDGQNNYEWSQNGLQFSNGVFSTQRRVLLTPNPNQEYFARFRDNNGNLTQVPAISFRGTRFPAATITTIGSTDFCDGNQVTLKANDAFYYEWSNGSRNKEITVTNSGSYAVKIINEFGCVSGFSAATNIVSKPVPPKPSISVIGSLNICPDSSVTLQSSNQQANSFIWNNGVTDIKQKIMTAGNYTVKAVSNQGCVSPESDGVKININPLPATPVITPSGSITFCADTSIVLTTSNQDAASILWSNSVTNRSQRVSTSGTFSVKVTNSQGCPSARSNEVKIAIKPLPSTPSIVPNGPTTFCADTNVVLTSSNQEATSYRWNTGAVTRNITVKNSGDFSVRSIGTNGCLSSTSLATRIKVNALPPAPTLSYSKDTVFCQGDNTILTLNIQKDAFPTWLAIQDGKTSRFNFQNLNVVNSGSFSGFQTDLNNCKSAISSSIYIAVKPTPAKITTISRLSPYSVGFENTKANSYIWQFNGANRDDFKGTTIRINDSGRYRVTAKNVYKTQSYGDKICVSDLSDEFLFELYNDNGISIYPNPSKGIFNIDSKVDWIDSNVEIYSLKGELFKKTFVTVFDDVKTVDLTSLPEGEYMLRIRTDNFYTITKRIIINR